MPTSYKILGQVSPADANNADLYTVPVATSTVVSSIVLTNTSGANSLCRIFARKNGAPAGKSNALIYDGVVLANDFKSITLGITLSAGDMLTVRTDVGDTMTFQAFGSEVS